MEYKSDTKFVFFILLMHILNFLIRCSSLEELPNISKWNIKNIIDMSFLFNKFYKMKYLPDILNWDLSNAINISGIFVECSSLESLPDLSKWNTNQIINIIYLIYFVNVLK